MITTEEMTLLSTNQKNHLHVRVWYNNNQKYKAIVQISHGMIEHIGRYDRFARFLANEGYFVVANDHLGHGQSVANQEELGYFPSEHMSQTLVDDLHMITLEVKNKHPLLPVFILGHSMGSLLLRRYMMTYGDEINGAIIIGTGSISPLILTAGSWLVRFMTMTKGDTYHSPMIEYLLFGAYNKHFSENRFGKEWLTKDTKIVDTYYQDSYCQFTFSLNGIQTLIDTMKFIQKKSNIEKIPKTLPLIFMSGTEDPFGDYGRGVNHIYEKYKKLNIEDISIQMFDNDRHEILNELDYRDVYKKIRKWLDKRC